MAHLLAVLSFATIVAAVACAQSSQTPDQHSSPSIQEKSEQTPGKPVEASGTDRPALSGASNDRLFLLTEKKVGVVAIGAFERIEYPWYGLRSAINQPNDAEPAHAQDRSQKQEQSAPTPVPKPETRSTQKSEQERNTEKREQSKRVLGVVPQFGVTNRQDAPPLTSREKFHLFAKSAFDPISIGVVGVQAALSQADNQFPAYGQGAQGYGKRFGAALADEVDAGFWSNYAYPALLKQDPRYFRLGEGGFLRRVGYSVKQEFVCHTDKGGRSFNFSTILGAFTSGAISNLYYPGNTLVRIVPASATSPAVPVYHNDRGAALTLSRASIALTYGMIGGLFDEFWPDIQSRLFKRHKPDGQSPTP